MSEDKSNVVHISIPTHLHPATIRGDGPAAEIARAALGQLNATAAEINDAAPGIESKKRLAEVVIKISERALNRLDKAADQLAFHVKTTRAEVDAAVNVATAPDVAQQIRAHFKAEKNPRSAIITAIREGDARTAAAVLSAPPYLSGLTPSDVETIRTAAEVQFAPEAVKKRASAQDAFDRIVKARDAYNDMMVPKVRRWADTDDDRLAKLAKLEKADG